MAHDTDESGREQFYRQAGRILNAGQTRSLILSGSIHDLFHLEEEEGSDSYVPLVDFLAAKWQVRDRILVVYELNGPLRFVREEDRELVKDAWLKWRSGLDSDEIAIKRMLHPSRKRMDLDVIESAFDSNLQDAVGKPTLALELMRQICLCSRSSIGGKSLVDKDLIILIEGADLIIPQGNLSSLHDADRHRVSICQDWFSDPGFMNGHDAVILLAESRSQIHERVARLPQVLEVAISAPNESDRKKFFTWFQENEAKDAEANLWEEGLDLAKFSAGLSIHALRQLLKGALYFERPLTQDDVVSKVEEHIQAQLGDDVVEFKKPSHTLADVVGFEKLKTFLNDQMIPRLRSSGADALPGAAVCGPIGGGKTFLFEAVAAELDLVVLVIKNVRSQWFGQTDVIFERLRRVLDALSKVVIFVDEADTQFGQVGPQAHATERRLTGKIQQMMSDPALRGRVFWLLMTARIHLLSPDIRRPGRVGDLIIPVLDPETDHDRDAFLRWLAAPVLAGDAEDLGKLSEVTPGYSAANFASMRAELIARAKGGKLTQDEILEIVQDYVPPAIRKTRRYQTLQALVNCTRRSLLPDPTVDESARETWSDEIRQLEAQGIR